MNIIDIIFLSIVITILIFIKVIINIILIKIIFFLLFAPMGLLDQINKLDK